ncbi:FecR family protein [Pseudozobellia thermophila]|uniref:FecR family protein n=1 Tax=Pseudozobellia thermophila TaxID=192903 RepID=A0A1M6KDJ7_9FLAO|nr:FecR domain-containing protein [Pseudozobellia thermophila]SHJ57001.1 FecR family protein [Pseudozobellia thermophila]
MSKKDLKSVLERIKNTEKIDTKDLIGLSDEEKQLIYQLYNGGLLDESLRLMEESDTDESWNALKNKIADKKTPVIPLWRKFTKYAAVFVGVAAVLYMVKKEDTSLDPTELQPQNSITLKVGESKVKLIKENDEQKIVSTDGIVVGKQNGNTLTYSNDSQIDRVIYNELKIPNGKIFNVELSDGTSVHLNSGTRIKYPVKFLPGHNREVFIEGEAYFKVAKDTEHPFIVNADAVAVRVLGTEFNITSYADDKEIRTVLVEGSVDMTNTFAPGDKALLKPGQKAIWTKTAHTTQIEEVDVEIYTAWLSGELIFRDVSFNEMAKKLERQYNVSIVNNNTLLATKTLNARFNVKVENIEDILTSLKQIQNFDYRIEDRTIIID